MNPQAETYDDDVLDVVNRFLQTVVVIDDRAFRDTAPSIELPEETGGAPGGRAIRSDLQIPSEPEKHDLPNEHDLDAKKVTDAFARDGLICGLLEPSPGTAIDDELLLAVRRADLVVIDWVLDRDNGAKALKLIGNILADEAETPERQRLRTIAIYTGQPELRQIAAKVREIAEKVYPDDELVEHDDGLALTKGPVRIAVFAKENAPKLAPDLVDRRIFPADLPARLRREFAVLTNGLITSVALAALAALRDDTHRILKVLNPGLDAAYLGHRSALPAPRDAERHAMALVASELRSVIEDHNVGQQVNEDVLTRWVSQQRKDGLKFGRLIVEGSDQITGAQITAMLSRGLGDDGQLAAIQEMGGVSKSKWKTIKKNATRVFAHTLEEADDADAELARCMMLRTIYAHPERTLQLGTVVQSVEGDYLVCVQPVCDSVRLKQEGRPFPFLKLSISNREKSHLIVPGLEDGEWDHLLILTNPRDIVVEDFSPKDRHDSISATRVEKEYLFENVSGRSFRWVCELKSEFAQKIAVDLASEFSQVAVDEAEVLRLSR
jgi:hypothetical protein